MTTSNDKPSQPATTESDNTTKAPIANGKKDLKPTADRDNESKVNDPTTQGDGTKKPWDPNNPQAKQEAPGVDHSKAMEKA